MKIFRFYEEQVIKMPIGEAWEFFSNPKNLSEITPPGMNFRITNNPDSKIYPGMIITYKVSPMFNIPVTWVTEIVQAEENKYFIDEQRFGPYKMWHHTHTFKETENGILMTDEVYYALPLRPIGNIANKLIVAKKIKEIFAYRKSVLNKLFSQKKPVNSSQQKY